MVVSSVNFLIIRWGNKKKVFIIINLQLGASIATRNYIHQLFFQQVNIYALVANSDDFLLLFGYGYWSFGSWVKFTSFP